MVETFRPGVDMIPGCLAPRRQWTGAQQAAALRTTALRTTAQRKRVHWKRARQGEGRQAETPPTSPMVYVLDPDPATRDSVQDVLRGTALDYQAFSTAREFLAALDPSRPGCLVLEQRIPDMSGLQIQRRLSERSLLLPAIFVLAQGSVSLAVELLRGGAVHVLEKPVRPIELWNAIEEAVARNQDCWRVEEARSAMRERLAILTSKERQVLGLIGMGKSVKVMAAELGISGRAVELRRRQLIGKLQFHSTLELLRFAVAADLGSPQPPEAFASLVRQQAPWSD